MTVPTRPKLLTVAEIARRLGWRRIRTWRMLVRLGVIEVTKGSRMHHLIPVANLLRIKPGLSILEDDDC